MQGLWHTASCFLPYDDQIRNSATEWVTWTGIRWKKQLSTWKQKREQQNTGTALQISSIGGRSSLVAVDSVKWTVYFPVFLCGMVPAILFPFFYDVLFHVKPFVSLHAGNKGLFHMCSRKILEVKGHIAADLGQGRALRQEYRLAHRHCFGNR